MALTNSSFVAHFDADDIWPPGRAIALHSVLDAQPDLDAVFGRAEEFLDADAPSSARASESPISARVSTAGLIRRRAFERLGAFSGSEEGDQIWWSTHAISRGLRYADIDTIALRRRIHSTNISLTRRTELDRSRLSAIRSIVNQRRASDEPGADPIR